MITRVLPNVLPRPAWAILALGIGLSLPGPAPAQQADSPDVLLEKARYEAEIRGDLEAAIRFYQDVVEHHGDRREVAALALLELGEAYQTLGRNGAREAWDRIVTDYADQAEAAAAARARLAALAPEAAAEPTGVVARQIWSSQVDFTRGAVAPDAAELAFTDWGFLDDEALPGKAQIGVVDVRTRRSRPVGSIPLEDTYAVSPVFRDDGRRLVYSMWDTTWTHMKLRVVDRDGSEDRILVGENRHQRILALDWRSSTGQVAARVEDWDGVDRIGLISERDGSIRMIRSLGKHSLESLALSPDGGTLVYAYPPEFGGGAEAGGGAHDLHLIRSDGSAAAPLAAHPADDRFPLWTPDGHHVVFLSDRSGRQALWSVEVADGREAGPPRLVQSDVGDIEPIGMTASGAVAYRKRVLRTFVNTARLDLEAGRFTSEPRDVSERYIGTHAMPAWSPDGSRLAWHSIRGSGRERTAYLVVRDLASGEERSHELPFMPYLGLHTPRWSGDGRHVFMEAGDFSSRVSYRVHVETGAVIRQPFLRSASGVAARRRDAATERQAEGLRSLGLRLAGQNDATPYLEGDAKIPPGETVLQVRNGIAVLDPSEPDPEAWEWWTDTRHVHTWSLSPDGRSIALAMASDPGPDGMSDYLVVFSLENRGVREIARPDVPPGMEINTVRWTSDGRHILFTISDNHEEAFPVWSVPAEGGEARELDLELTQYELVSMAFHPRDDTVAFTSLEQWLEVWLLEGLPWQQADSR